MPEQSDNTNPYFVQPFCTDTALDPDGVLQTDKWLPAFLRKKTQIAPEPQLTLDPHLIPRKNPLPPKTNKLIVSQNKIPSWTMLRYLQNNYWTSYDNMDARIIGKRGSHNLYLFYYRTDKCLYECLYVRNMPHSNPVRRILVGDARDILTNDGPIQFELKVPMDSPHVIWCTSGERDV